MWVRGSEKEEDKDKEYNYISSTCTFKSFCFVYSLSSSPTIYSLHFQKKKLRGPSNLKNNTNFGLVAIFIFTSSPLPPTGVTIFILQWNCQRKRVQWLSNPIKWYSCYTLWIFVFPVSPWCHNFEFSIQLHWKENSQASNTPEWVCYLFRLCYYKFLLT